MTARVHIDVDSETIRAVGQPDGPEITLSIQFAPGDGGAALAHLRRVMASAECDIRAAER